MGILVIFQNCVVQPHATVGTSLASLSIDHSSMLSNCASCHQSQFNTQQAQASGHINIMLNGTQQDCSTCHLSGRGVTWVIGGAGGMPATVSLASPTGMMWSLKMPHPVPAAGVNCNSCHGSSDGPLLVGWDHANAPLPTSTSIGGTSYCMFCHFPNQQNVAATSNDSPNFKVFDSTNSDHAGVQIPSQDCTSCHTYPGTGVLGSSLNPPNWLGAGPPAMITLPAPTGSGFSNLTMNHPLPVAGESCSQCHGSSNGPTVIAWDHNNAPPPPAGSVGYCVYCHTSTQNVVAATVFKSIRSVPTNHQGGLLATDTCAFCHTSGKDNHQINYPNPWYSLTGSLDGP